MTEISIITPVYNTEKYLRECIESVLNQSFQDFELILINDGSPDNSYKILEEYEKKDSRIKVITKENEGQGVARNIALPYAKGNYVLYLDSDDWLEENALQDLYNKFQEDNYDVVFFNVYRYYQETGNKNTYRFIDCFYSRFGNEVFNIENAADILFETNGLPFKAYNRKFLVDNNIKYTATKYIEDSEFFIKAVLTAKKMCCLNKCIVNYRVHNESSVSTTHKNIDVFEKTFYICEKVFLEYYWEYKNDKLLSSYLKNRIQQLFCHFRRVKKSHKKQFYDMMRRLFKYIDSKYGQKHIESAGMKFSFNQVLNHSFYGYTLIKIFTKWFIHLKVYVEI